MRIRRYALIVGVVERDGNNLLGRWQHERQTEVLVGATARLAVCGLVADLVRIPALPSELRLADGWL
jgi:hypothetical protein